MPAQTFRKFEAGTTLEEMTACWRSTYAAHWVATQAAIKHIEERTVASFMIGLSCVGERYPNARAGSLLGHDVRVKMLTQGLSQKGRTAVITVNTFSRVPIDTDF